MAHSTSPSKDKGKTKKTYLPWTSEMDKVLAACLIEEINKGNRLDGKCAWKSTSWTAAINALYEQLKVSVDKAKILSRLKTWEKHYDILHPILVSNNSGSPITWDHAKGRIEVHDENVWRERLEANPKLLAYRGKIIVDNWDDICTIFSQDRASGQGARTFGEASVKIEIEASSAQKSFEAADEDDAMSMLMARQERLKKKENASSSSSRGMKRKNSDSEVLDVLVKMSDSLDRFMMTDSRRATTEEVLKELDKVDLNLKQKLLALDLLMENQRLFDTFSGMPDHLRLPWITMHLSR